MLAPDLEQQLAHVVGHGQGVALPTRDRAESVETLRAVAAMPAQHRHRVAAGAVAARRFEAAPGDRAELGEQLAAVQVLVEDGAEHLRSKQSDMLGVVLKT